jgi:hypothetical protein
MFSFRLWTIFYVFALAAAAMATFGPWGLVPAAMVLGFWAAAFHSKAPLRAVVKLLVVICIIGSLAAFLMPAVGSARSAVQRSNCMSNLKQIQSAILNYEAANGSIPRPTLSIPKSGLYTVGAY